MSISTPGHLKIVNAAKLVPHDHGLEWLRRVRRRRQDEDAARFETLTGALRALRRARVAERGAGRGVQGQRYVLVDERGVRRDAGSGGSSEAVGRIAGLRRVRLYDARRAALPYLTERGCIPILPSGPVTLMTASPR